MPRSCGEHVHAQPAARFLIQRNLKVGILKVDRGEIFRSGHTVENIFRFRSCAAVVADDFIDRSSVIATDSRSVPIFFSWV